MSTNSLPKSDITLPIHSTITKVKGFGTLTIYMMKMSKYWYMRVRINRKIVRRCLKTENKKDAVELAKKKYLELHELVLNQEPINKSTGFKIIAEKLLKETEQKLSRGEVSRQKYINDEYRLKNDLLPFFRKYKVNEINYQLVSEYFEQINKHGKRVEHPLSTNSLKIHKSHIDQILKHAQKLNVIQTAPLLPTFSTQDKTRAAFNKGEYSELHGTLRNNIGKKYTVTNDEGKKIRNVTLTDELYDLIIFMMNTFIRPTDIRVLKHSHITIVNNKNTYLRLDHPSTKKHSDPVVSLESAVNVYQRIVERQKSEGIYKPDGYVFMPEYENRTYALRQLERQFNFLLDICNLKTNAKNEERSLYSLRHSSLLFRILEAENLDLLTLARNARTSPDMLDRFYLKRLSPEMNIEKLQSQRNPKLKKTK